MGKWTWLSPSLMNLREKGSKVTYREVSNNLAKD